MGLKLSTSGNLTFSQKKSVGIKNVQAQQELFKKLEKLPINKPILEQAKKDAEQRKKEAAERKKKNDEITSKGSDRQR